MLPELSANMKVYVQLQPQSRDWKPATVTVFGTQQIQSAN